MGSEDMKIRIEVDKEIQEDEVIKIIRNTIFLYRKYYFSKQKNQV